MEMFTGPLRQSEIPQRLAGPSDGRHRNTGRPPGTGTGAQDRSAGSGYQWKPLHEKPVHDAIVDQLIASPGINCVQLATIFKYSPAAMRMMLKSDLIREKLAQRREDLVDPILKNGLEERFAAMLEVSLDRATQLISTSQDLGDVIKGVDVAAKAMGYGARPAGSPGGGNNVQFVVVNPGVAPNSQAWAQTYGPLAHGGEVQDLDVRESSGGTPDVSAFSTTAVPQSHGETVRLFTEAGAPVSETDRPFRGSREDVEGV